MLKKFLRLIVISLFALTASGCGLISLALSAAAAYGISQAINK